MPARLVRIRPGIMGIIFSAAVHCAAAYDVQRNMHMNDHADSPFVLLSWSARKCICIMQRLIGVMGNVITASTVHYFRLILPAQFCYEKEWMCRALTLCNPICQPRAIAAAPFKIFFRPPCVSIYRRRTLPRESGRVSGLPGETSIVSKYTQMRFRIVLHKLV